RAARARARSAGTKQAGGRGGTNYRRGTLVPVSHDSGGLSRLAHGAREEAPHRRMSRAGPGRGSCRGGVRRRQAFVLPWRLRRSGFLPGPRPARPCAGTTIPTPSTVSATWRAVGSSGGESATPGPVHPLRSRLGETSFEPGCHRKAALLFTRVRQVG